MVATGVASLDDGEMTCGDAGCLGVNSVSVAKSGWGFSSGVATAMFWADAREVGVEGSDGLSLPNLLPATAGDFFDGTVLLL